MKKLFLIAMIAFSTLGITFAQSFDIRAYGGFNILQLTSDQGESIIDDVLHNRTVSGRPGYQGGVALTFGERFYVQPGFQFSKLSTEVVNKNTVTGDELIDETSLNVISVPLKVGFRLINPEAENFFNIRVFAGFDGHHVTSVNHSTKSDQGDEITKDDYANLIMNADFGMGIDLWFLFVESGYQLGLSPVHTGGDNAKSNAFYGNIGIKIGF